MAVPPLDPTFSDPQVQLGLLTGCSTARLSAMSAWSCLASAEPAQKGCGGGGSQQNAAKTCGLWAVGRRSLPATEPALSLLGKSSPARSTCRKISEPTDMGVAVIETISPFVVLVGV